MIRSLLSKFALLLCLSLLMTFTESNAQKTVFTENFNAPGTAQSSSWTTSGPINNSRWNVSRSGNDFGAKIDGGTLALSNDVSSAGNVKGWVLASTTVANFAPGYNPILNQNAGIVSWTFNMKQPRSNPSGLTDNNYGVAYVLAGTEGSTFSTGSGYAIMLGNGNSKDAIRFVHYTNGISSYYTRFTSDVQGFRDFGRDYISVKVEYNPATSKWSFYLRKDNPTFLDPKGGTLYYQGDATNNEHITKSLTMTGAYWVASNGNNQTALFDNISVDVVLPEITAINPDSKIANSGLFNLQIEGKGFTQATKVYWDGVLKPTTYISSTQLAAGIAATDIQLPRILPITLRNGAYESNAVDFEIEPSGVPSLTLSKNTLPFVSTVAGIASLPTDPYTITGINLTAVATVTAPANFEISFNNGTYADVLTLTNSAGNLTNQPLTLKARLKATAPAGNFSGNITHTTNGAVTKQVAVSGRVLATEPSASATGISFTNITSTGFKLNWTNGSGEQRLVLIRESSAVTALPVDATTYIAAAAFANGAEIGTGNYVVYKGVGNNVQITALQPNKTYHISVVEFNGAVGTENYRASGLIGNATTLNSPAGLQIKIANTSYKIDFDNTVDGVNLDTFQGSGIAKIAEAGQLDSDSWAFTGFSGGAIAFGGESLEDSSYENGASDGNEIDTGMYAFNVGTTEVENYTLGVQPGGSDFNPGTVTLKIQNQTGVAMTSVNIGYKVYVNNDQDASSRIRLSYGSNATGAYTDQIIADVISPTTTDLAPGWKAYYRVVTIPNLNIASNSYYYIRWSGSLVSGTGAQDEFAIDDIEVIANPTTNTVGFDGIAEDFVLQGNANLSADLSVQKSIVFNGGKLAITDKNLTIAGSVTNTTVNGLIGGTNSNLIVRGTKNPALSFDQAIVGTTNALQNFSLIGANANIVTMTNPLQVSQLLAVDEQQILNFGTNSLLGTLNSIQNNGIIQTQNTTAAPFTSGKTWNGTGILNLNATSAAQTLVAGTYNNLTLSSTAGTTAAADATVNGILHLPAANASATKGSLDMASYTLIMGPDGINTGIGEVTGIIRRDLIVINKLYTFGHPNSSIIFPGGGITLPTTMSAKLTIGAEPTWRAGTVKRQFDIIQTGAVDTKAVIRQHYLDSELNNNVESKLVFWANKIGAPVPVFDQGRSNNNTTENWVEISNANVGLYFTNTFDQVYISLDETSGSDLVWNGSTSTSWTTSTNWTPAGVPSNETKVFIPNVSSTSNRSPIINAASSVKSIIIDTGGIVNTPANSVLDVFDGAGAWQNTGIFNPTNGTVIFNNLDATISGSTTFNNLTIASGTGLRALDGSYMSIVGALTNDGTMFTTLIPNTIEFKGTNQVIPNVNGLDFGGYHNLVVSGAGATFASTITTLNVRGNMTLNQVVPFTGKTINLAGVADQTIGGTAAINFNNLIVNKETAAVILASDIAVNGTLTLTKGNLVLDDKNLSLGSNSVSGTFGNNTMIVADKSGTVTRKFTSAGSYLFPIGELTGAPSYSPITVAFTGGTFGANAIVAVNVVDAKHPKNFSSQNFISRYWNVTQTGITNAVANITAIYDPLDFNGEESAIAAAQLQGSFDLLSNPWTKFASLANNTLFAEGAVLTSGQNSVFSGIKQGGFSVEVFGYGDFCLDSDVQIEAVVTNGDAPFTYIWSNGLPDSATVTIPTTVVGTTDYTLTVIDANGFRSTDTNIPVAIFPQTAGGTISGNAQVICAGSKPNDLELIGSIGKILYWQSSTDINFVIDTENNTDDVTNFSNFTTTLSGNQIGAVNQTTYFRAVLQNGDCNEQFSSIATVTIKSTTWNGTEWNAGEPNSSTSAIFEANYTATASIEACTILVTNGAAVIIPAYYDVTLNGALTVESGSFKMESNTNLIQLTNVENSGNIIVERESSNLFKLDYTMWGSPVTGAQTLKQFSPLTVSSRFYTYNTSTDQFNALTSETNTFAPGKGYLIRMPDNHTIYGPAVLATSWTGTFEGKPTNGTVTAALNQTFNGFNMISNPYPSMISADAFLTENSSEIDGTLYFWRRRNAVQDGSAYYATYTLAGGTGTAGSASVPNQVPNGFIQVGQGFITKAKSSGIGNAVFTNLMRNKANNDNQFFKNSNSQERSRIWLNVSNTAGEFGQTLVAYMPQADNDLDRTDGKYLGDGSTALTSWLDNSEYIIQGRAPFVNSDVVALNFKTLTAGTYTISIDHVDGLFEGSQDIFLRDHTTGTLHDLKSSAYAFAAEAGSFNTRFDIVYLNPLSVGDPVFDSKSVILYKKENTVVINSGSVTLDNVEVYDIRGRLLAVAKSINSNEVSINVGETNQVLIVKITSIDGIKVTKKTVN